MGQRNMRNAFKNLHIWWFKHIYEQSTLVFYKEREGAKIQTLNTGVSVKFVLVFIRVPVDHFFCDLRSDQDHFVKKWSKIRSRSWSWIFQKSDLRSDRDLRSRSLFYGKIFSMP